MDMDKIYTMMATFFAGMYDRDESEDRGAGIVEYALLVALIAVVAGVAIAAFGTQLADFFSGLAAEVGIGGGGGGD
jgi:pilus assembly protein Flp/PilA